MWLQGQRGVCGNAREYILKVTRGTTMLLTVDHTNLTDQIEMVYVVSFLVQESGDNHLP